MSSRGLISRSHSSIFLWIIAAAAEDLLSQFSVYFPYAHFLAIGCLLLLSLLSFPNTTYTIRVVFFRRTKAAVCRWSWWVLEMPYNVSFYVPKFYSQVLLLLFRFFPSFVALPPNTSDIIPTPHKFSSFGGGVVSRSFLEEMRLLSIAPCHTRTCY